MIFSILVGSLLISEQYDGRSQMYGGLFHIGWCYATGRARVNVPTELSSAALLPDAFRRVLTLVHLPRGYWGPCTGALSRFVNRNLCVRPCCRDNTHSPCGACIRTYPKQPRLRRLLTNSPILSERSKHALLGLCSNLSVIVASNGI